MSIELTKEDRLRILRELQTKKCFCGAKKAEGQTFCRQDYYKLPPKMRTALYSRFADGYEEAYTEARDWLKERAHPAVTGVE